MPSTIITKNSSTASAVPSAGSLTQGELAVNVTDKKLYTKDSGGSVVTLTDSMARQASNNVSITGGSITGITDLAVADGGTGASTFSSNAVLLGNGTSSFQTVAPGANGNILTSNGTTWTSAAPAASGSFDAGTRMMFAQTSAPTGWTKDTTNYNNHALRVVTGAASTGGSVDFTTAFASQAVSGTVGTSGATTLSTSQIPSHDHWLGWYTSGACSGPGAPSGPATSGAQALSGSTGGGGSHTHSGGTFTGNAINLAVKYLDVITATKN